MHRAHCPRIHLLLDQPPFQSLPHHLRERLFNYVATNKLFYIFDDVAKVARFFVHEGLEEFDLTRNGGYVDDAVINTLQCCTGLKSLTLKYPPFSFLPPTLPVRWLPTRCSLLENCLQVGRQLQHMPRWPRPEYKSVSVVGIARVQARICDSQQDLVHDDL